MVSDHRRSYWKTVIPALFASATLLTLVGALIGGALTAGPAWSAARWSLWLAAALVLAPLAVVCTLVAAGGLISLRRDTLEALGRPYGQPGSDRALPPPEWD